jgi:hypothetical protein
MHELQREKGIRNKFPGIKARKDFYRALVRNPQAEVWGNRPELVSDFKVEVFLISD